MLFRKKCGTPFQRNLIKLRYISAIFSTFVAMFKILRLFLEISVLKTRKYLGSFAKILGKLGENSRKAPRDFSEGSPPPGYMTRTQDPCRRHATHLSGNPNTLRKSSLRCTPLFHQRTRLLACPLSATDVLRMWRFRYIAAPRLRPAPAWRPIRSATLSRCATGRRPQLWHSTRYRAPRFGRCSSYTWSVTCFPWSANKEKMKHFSERLK